MCLQNTCGTIVLRTAAFSCNHVCQQGHKKDDNLQWSYDRGKHFWCQWQYLPKNFSIQPTSARTAWCQWKCHQKKTILFSQHLWSAFTFHMGQYSIDSISMGGLYGLAVEAALQLDICRSVSRGTGFFCEISNTNIIISPRLHSFSLQMWCGVDRCQLNVHFFPQFA